MLVPHAVDRSHALAHDGVHRTNSELNEYRAKSSNVSAFVCLCTFDYTQLVCMKASAAYGILHGLLMYKYKYINNMT